MGAGGGQWQSQHGEDVAHVPSDRLPAGSKPARPLTVVEQLPDGAEDLLGALPRFLITCLIRVLAPRITAAAHATMSGVVNMRPCTSWSRGPLEFSGE
jgi:hypothetical protein